MKIEKASLFSCKTMNLGLAVVLLLFLLSGIALLPRLRAERENRSAAIVLDYRDVVSLAAKEKTSPDDLWPLLAIRGAGGLMVSELMGQDLAEGALSLYYGPVWGLPEGARKNAPSDSSAPALFLPRTSSQKKEQVSFLSNRFPGTKIAEADGGTVVFLPRSQKELFFTGILPDLSGLLLAKKQNIPVFYRVAPALPGDTQPAVETLSRLLGEFSSIRVIAPSGDVALGFPDLRPLSSAITEAGRSVAMVEFSRQIGAAQLNWNAYPSLLPLHSVTHEELLSRNISRSALKERFLRAVKERSVRLLIFRPSALESSDNPLTAFLSELDDLAATLKAHGIALA